MDDEKLVSRAVAAYFRSGGYSQPANSSGLTKVHGRSYVVLENVNGPLAVYRVRPAGTLRRVRRWPPAAALIL